MGELILLFVVGVLIVGCVVVPLRRYANAHTRGKPLWCDTVVQTYATPGGAYRGSLVREEHRVYVPPRLVEGVAMSSSFLGMMWLPSLPMVGLGLFIEGDEGRLGPALLFGLPGMLLSLCIFLTGPKLLECKRVDGARFVAIWSILHNAAILVAIVVMTLNSPSRLGVSDEWEMYSLSLWVGWVALAYVAGSIVHAVAMLRAARACEAALWDDGQREVLEFAAAVR